MVEDHSRVVDCGQLGGGHLSRSIGGAIKGKTEEKMEDCVVYLYITCGFNHTIGKAPTVPVTGLVFDDFARFS